MAGVEDHRHAIEPARFHLVLVLPRQAALDFVLEPPRVVRRQELRQQNLERNPHRKADRNTGDIGNAAAGGDVLSQCLAKLAQFDQRGVGVGGKDLLGSSCKLQEHRVMLGEESEVAGNDQAPACWLVIAFGMGVNLTRF